jgi:hypothetical protein
MAAHRSAFNNENHDLPFRVLLWVAMPLCLKLVAEAPNLGVFHLNQPCFIWTNQGERYAMEQT